jgi:hypothetical protein
MALECYVAPEHNTNPPKNRAYTAIIDQFKVIVILDA